uniref:Indoleamine 2,3-dioxygenase n=1 Tax=viral metagenome TaxID=1070528 RepID=A0A6C0I882_9ZZZZ
MSYWDKSYTDGFFDVSCEHGFLPIKDPLKVLPEKFDELQNLISKLHVFYSENNCKNGILGIPNEIVKQVGLVPDYSDLIELETDVFVLQALYRAYTFVTSGFTLEQAYQEFLKSGNYGVARQLLPANIAVPLVLVSKKLDVYPWLDYHYSYSLGNYVKKDSSGDLHWQNLDMACKFTGTSDEIGFIMVHVYINEVSPNLVSSVINYGKNKDTSSLQLCGRVMQEMNRRRRDMWSASRHERYNDFRIFIMGIKGNDNIFGKGLVYEDCFDNLPQQYRGQTGAQDSIIPMIDIFSGIVDYYPDNKLTEYLLDLRTYRPKCIQNFFVDLRNHYKEQPLFKQLTDAKCYEGLVYLLKIVDEVYLFRNGHWQFVQKYIMSNTKYAFATGGTPITSWLINQIEAVLEYERVIIGHLNKNYIEELKENELWINLSDTYNKKKDLLVEQVNELKKIDYNIEFVYKKNSELDLEDSKL